MVFVRIPKPEDFAATHVARERLPKLAELIAQDYLRRRTPNVRGKREFVLVGDGDDRVHSFIRPHRAECVPFTYSETFNVAVYKGALALGTSQWVEPHPTFTGDA